MISVVLAAFHGEDYIANQVTSILAQLSANDELIITDDDINGQTKQAVAQAAPDDKRIRYIAGPGKGVVYNFEYGLSQAKGDIIFLSDQDDVWLPDKVKTCTDILLNNDVDFIMHDAFLTNAALEKTGGTFFTEYTVREGYWKNIIRNSFKGCCMVFRRSVLTYALPFPEKLPMHDQWIGLLATRYARVQFLDTPLILHRRHEQSITGGEGGSITEKIKWRMSLLLSLAKRNKKIKKEILDGRG